MKADQNVGETTSSVQRNYKLTVSIDTVFCKYACTDVASTNTAACVSRVTLNTCEMARHRQVGTKAAIFIMM